MAIVMNKVILVGRVGYDPEQSGSGPVRFSVATSKTFKDRDGERQEKTQWHKVVVWNKFAQEFSLKYVKKGDLVAVEGEMEYRVWEKDDGEKVNITEVVVSPYSGSVQSMKREGGESSERTSRDDKDTGRGSSGYGGGSRDLDDEIPF